MKKLSSFFVILFLLGILSLNAQIKVKSTGFVGIGTNNPSTYFEVLGNSSKFSFINTGSYDACPIFLDRYMDTPRFYPNTNHKGYIGQANNFWSITYSDRFYYVYGCTQYSDVKFKKNITPLSNSLDKVLRLKGVKYDLDYSSIGSTKEDDEKFGKNQFGLIAQDVLAIVPEVVSLDSNGYGVDYIKLIPLLIEAIKDQQKQIETLKSSVASFKSAESQSILSTGVSSTIASLGKNIPNPFNVQTTINFYLPTEVKTATFYVYDLQGKQIMSNAIQERESGSIIISASQLQPGMYKYALIADGSVIGIETMILTD